MRRVSMRASMRTLPSAYGNIGANHELRDREPCVGLRAGSDRRAPLRRQFRSPSVLAQRDAPMSASGLEIGKKYVALVKEGKGEECLNTLFAKDAVSVEAGGPPGMDRT